MPTAFCSLEDAYGDWNRKPQQTQQQNENKNNENKNNENNSINTKYENTTNDIRNFCPNCKSCLKANDELQQKIINQIVWPRPRWTPQIPDAYVQHDPYNRYWTNAYSINGREDFGNPNSTNVNVDMLLKVIIFVLSVLFVVQIIEIFNKSE
jgi:hypothetical protein